MRQRILGSHTPPCHRRMVITTQFRSFVGGGGLHVEPDPPPPHSPFWTPQPTPMVSDGEQTHFPR